MIGAPELCVGAVVVEDGRLLLIRRGTAPQRGYWSVPGGRVDPGETMVEAVVRELREETGLEGVCGELIGWVERMTDDRHLVILDFAAAVLGGRLQAGTDALEVEWVAFDELSARPLVDGLMDFLTEHQVIEEGPSIRPL